MAPHTAKPQAGLKPGLFNSVRAHGNLSAKAITPSQAPLRRARTLFLLPLALAGLLCGCAHTAPKPNAAQKWGAWSYVPGTAAWNARRASEVLAPRADEARRELTKATDELISEAQIEDARRTPETAPPNLPLAAAKTVARQNVLLHGEPDKPLDTRPLVSTNDTLRDAAFARLLAEFKGQQQELANVKAVLAKQAQRGAVEQKQESAASVTAWNFTDWIVNFLNAHWFLLVVLAIAAFYAGRAALAVYNPALALGVNKVQGLGVAGIRRVAAEVIHGGERFQAEVEKKFKDSPDLVADIRSLFKTSHQIVQSPETQAAVSALTAPAFRP